MRTVLNELISGCHIIFVVSVVVAILSVTPGDEPPTPRVVLNELSMYGLDKFIEIKSYSSSQSLDDFYISIMDFSTTSGNRHLTLNLRGLINLSGKSTSNHLGFIGDNVPSSTCHLKGFGNTDVKYASSSWGQANIFNVPQRGYVIILLHYSPGKNLDMIWKDEDIRPLKNEMEYELIESAVDSVFIKGGKTAVKGCPKLQDIFANILVTEDFKMHMDISTLQGKSLSLCSEVLEPNQQDKFEVTQSTKALENDCPGLRIDMRQHIEQVMDDDPSTIERYDLCEGGNSAVQTSSQKYSEVLDKQKKSTCELNDRNIALTNLRVDTTDSRKRKITNDPR